MRPILLRDACVVTMHPTLGELSRGAVLIDGDRIAAVAPDIEVGDAETIDARGFIVIPGLINSHMHTWQTALRGAAANWTLLEYFRWVHAGPATQFRPEDIHIATLAGALNQSIAVRRRSSTGITTTLRPSTPTRRWRRCKIPAFARRSSMARPSPTRVRASRISPRFRIRGARSNGCSPARSRHARAR